MPEGGHTGRPVGRSSVLGPPSDWFQHAGTLGEITEISQWFALPFFRRPIYDTIICALWRTRALSVPWRRACSNPDIMHHPRSRMNRKGTRTPKLRDVVWRAPRETAASGSPTNL